VTESFNPYEPPQATVGDETPQPFGRRSPENLVGSGKRFLNSLIDGIFLYVVTTVINMVVVVALKPKDQSFGCFLLLFNLSVNFVYFTLFEHFFGKSIGKFVTKTIVINQDGDRPTLAQIMKRSASRFIPFECFTFFGEQSHGWHDSISNTFVVSDR
jgi:uncharacterized RDD family membrane protein YckC